MAAPAQKERPQKFTRQRLDFSGLDSIGHGVKVTESTEGIDKRYDRKHSGMEVRWGCTVSCYVRGSGCGIMDAIADS